MYVPSFPGQGAIYSVIVQQTGVISNTQKAAYVSSTSYSCTFDVNGSGQYCYDLGMYRFFDVCYCWWLYLLLQVNVSLLLMIILFLMFHLIKPG